MLRKTVLRRIILSFVLAITLTLGMASIGYCGGGFAEPPGPGESFWGPAIVGKIVIHGDPSDDATVLDFEGQCSGGFIKIEAEDISSTVYKIPKNANDLLHSRLNHGQMLLRGLCGPSEPHDADTDNPLIIVAATNFVRVKNSEENKAEADIVVLWIVTP